jgi:hypothetical protein
VNLQTDTNPISMADAPVYVGKFIEGHGNFKLATPWE